MEFTTVSNVLQAFPTVILLLAATMLEVSGDAVVPTALYNHVGFTRVWLLSLAPLYCLLWDTAQFGSVRIWASGQFRRLSLAPYPADHRRRLTGDRWQRDHHVLDA